MAVKKPEELLGADQAAEQIVTTDAGSEGIQPAQAQSNAAEGAGQNVPKAVSPADTTASFYQTPNYNGKQLIDNRPVYQQSQALRDAADQLTAAEAAKPGEYQSAYQDQIQGMIDNILGRGQFEYDPTQDPLYQAYADQYQREGRLAARDVQGQSAALTGGYGNTYGVLAGSQAYQRYLEKMNDQLPQMRAQAMQEYQAEGDRLAGNLGMLQGQDATDYGRYRDTVGDWQNEVNYFYQKFGDMSDDEYNRYLNDAAAWEKDRDAYWDWYAKYGKKGGGRGGKTTLDPALLGALIGSVGLGVGGVAGAVGDWADKAKAAAAQKEIADKQYWGGASGGSTAEAIALAQKRNAAGGTGEDLLKTKGSLRTGK